MSTTMKSAVHLGREYQQNLIVQEHELRGAQDVVRCHIGTDRGKFIRNSDLVYHDIWFLSLDETDSVSWSSHQVGRSKNACPHIQSCVWESCIMIQKRMKNDKNRSMNFNDQTSTQNCMELMENQLSSSGIFPGCTSIEILRQIQKVLQNSTKNPEQLEGRILFMSMFNDMDWTKNRISVECISNSKQVSDYAREDIGHSSFLEMRKMVWDVYSQIRREMGPASQSGYLVSSNEVAAPNSEAQVRSIVEYWSETQGETVFTSRRTQEFLSWFSAPFAQQISSVSTEQCRVGG